MVQCGGETRCVISPILENCKTANDGQHECTHYNGHSSRGRVTQGDGGGREIDALKQTYSFLG